MQNTQTTTKKKKKKKKMMKMMKLKREEADVVRWMARSQGPGLFQ